MFFLNYGYTLVISVLSDYFLPYVGILYSTLVK